MLKRVIGGAAKNGKAGVTQVHGGKVSGMLVRSLFHRPVKRLTWTEQARLGRHEYGVPWALQTTASRGK